MILAGLIAARFTHYTALVLLFGTASFIRFARLGGADGAAGEDETASRRLRSTLLWSSLAALAAAAGVLAFTAANMAGELRGMVDAATLRTILVDTDFGRIWSLRLALAAALAAWLVAARRREPSPAADWIVLLLAGALLATVALTGHAQIRTGLAGALHRTADAAHLVAAAVWLGALAGFLVLLAPSRSGGPENALGAGQRLQRFHSVGTVAVAALLVSGLVNSWFLVGGFGPLVSTTYGRLLLAKLALFGAMVALAADNRLRLVPRLNADLARGLPAEAWAARLRSHIRLEFGFGLAVLATVSVLGAIAPAIDAEPL
ncbi:MAG: copper homeostasis membrane protein CopD [Pseudomonadota bacterium]|nr:copper homeostasis membrane protein CopD [Pseudomonadota bacterium]